MLYPWRKYLLPKTERTFVGIFFSDFATHNFNYECKKIISELARRTLFWISVCVCLGGCFCALCSVHIAYSARLCMYLQM